MAVIQGYEQQVGAQGGLNVSVDPGQLGAVGAAISGFGDKLYENQVIDEVTAAHRLASKKTLEWQQELVNRSNSATPGDTTFATRLADDISRDLEKSASQFTTRRAQAVFSEATGKLVTEFGQKAIGVQMGLDRVAAKQDFLGAIDDESKTVNGDEKSYNAAVARINAMIDDPSTKYGRVDPATRVELKNLAKKALASSVVEGQFARDIVGVAKKLAPDLVNEAYNVVPAAGTASKFDSTLQFIFGEEGGYNPKDGKSNAPVNFGINQKYNPDVDVKNLTKAGAAAIYRERYWNVIGGDNLSPGLATVAMNAAVNMGAETAKTLLAQSGGDPATLTQLVKQRYQAIAQNDPQQAKYLNGWLARADRALVAASAPVDTQGQPIPQMKLPKDVALAPPQNVDVLGWKDLTLDDQQKFMATLVKDFNARMTVDRATLVDDRKNMTANFLNGRNYAGEAALQARYATAYGPEMARRMIQEDAINKDLGLFNGKIRGRSLDEINAALGPPPGDNSTADQFAAYGRKVAMIEADRKELMQSPVEYVAQYSTPVRQAALVAQSARANAEKLGTPDAIDAAATATQNLITASLAEQRRLGVTNPTILSAAEEKALQQRIQEIVGNGRDVAQGIDALYKSYGSYGPAVAAQMAPKVGGLMNVIGSGIDPAVSALLVEANRNKEQLKKIIPEDKQKDLADAVRTQMADFAGSMVGDENNANVQSTYQEQIGLLAMIRMSKLGESQKEAVKNAYKSLVGDKYTFQDGYRVPVEIDAKAIRERATATLRNISSRDVALLPGGPGNAEDRMTAQLSSIKSYGRWVTTAMPDSSGKMVEGLMLMVPTPGGFKPVPAADGKPLFRSFGQMLVDYQVNGPDKAWYQFGPQITFKAPEGMPSPYASAKEWEAYRAAQAGGKK